MGLYNDAEVSLELAWRHLPPREREAFLVGNDLVVVKYSLGKIEEGAALEKQLYGREWFRLPKRRRTGPVRIFVGEAVEQIVTRAPE